MMEQFFVSRTAWYFIPESFKIYIYVNNKIGAERIYNDKRASERYDSIEQAEKDLKRRFEMSKIRFMENYGIDISDVNNYDLYIDSSNLKIDEVLAIILSGYKEHLLAQEGNKIYEKQFHNN